MNNKNSGKWAFGMKFYVALALNEFSLSLTAVDARDIRSPLVSLFISFQPF